MKSILFMMMLSFIQNASFTVVSRARNSDSILYHGIASIFSSALWLIVLKNVVTNIDSWQMVAGYMIGTVSGSVGMHWFAMKFFEKKK